MGKQARKLFNKRTTSQTNVDQIKRIDGRNEQIADVRSGNLDDNSISRRVINQGAVGFDEIGIREVGGNRIYQGGVSNEHYANDSISTGKVRDNAITPDKLDRHYVSSIPDRTGSSDGLQGNHSHSISSTTFIKQPRSERMRMLNDRLDLEELLYSGHLHPEDAIVARNVHNVLILLMDYQEMNAYQRERAFMTKGLEQWADTYKRVYGVDEYAEEDRKNFLAYPREGVRMDPYTGIEPSGTPLGVEDRGN